jgi:hypothetical protein
MVDLDRIEKKLNELKSFFQNVKDSHANPGDKEGASYGLSKVESMLQNLSKYRKKPQNILLKRIHGGFTSATRGVEGFGDYETNEEFIKTGEGIYQIKKDLEQHIKW